MSTILIVELKREAMERDIRHRLECAEQEARSAIISNVANLAGIYYGYLTLSMAYAAFNPALEAKPK